MIEPYLFFEGRCEEAIDFYRQAIGAEVEMMMRFSDSPEGIPEGQVPPGSEDKIMHASLFVGGVRVMVSDGMCGGAPSFAGFSLSITAPDVATADRMYDALADGGDPHLPMARTFWSERFGMLTDRFGVGWMVTVPAEDA